MISSNTSSGANSQLVSPVHFTYLEADLHKDGSVQTRWDVADLQAGSVFMVERSADGANFAIISPEQKVATDEGRASYQYEDNEAPSVSQLYYRIAVREPGGLIYRSTVAVVRAKAFTGMQIKAITVQGSSVRTLLQLEDKGDYLLIVQSMEGAVLLRKVVSAEALSNPIADLSTGRYQRGVYIFTLSHGQQRISREFVY